MSKPNSTRYAYGEALVELGKANSEIVVLDAGTANSTYADLFAKAYPQRYFEMYIAEQNMVGVGVGLARRGKIPFLSTFAAFLTRAHDQIRMAAYSKANLKFTGSHCGVSIGVDGVSQMGLEDLSLFRSVPGAVVFYPSDSVAMNKLTKAALKYPGIVYLRTTREETPIIYDEKEVFEVGGLKIVKQSPNDRMAIIGAGITLHEALKANASLEKQGIKTRVIDLYCLKPLSTKTLKEALLQISSIVTVEDHYPEGGIGELVKSLLSGTGLKIHSLAVNKPPQSGKPEELLAYEEIDEQSIAKTVKAFLAI